MDFDGDGRRFPLHVARQFLDAGQPGLAPVIEPDDRSLSIHCGGQERGNTSLFLGMFEGLWSSVSLASSWHYIDTIPTRFIRYINLSPNYAQDQTIFASTYGGGNLWSTNGGSTWGFRNTGMFVSYTDASGISPNFANDGIAFSAMGFGLERTATRGENWERMAALGAICYPRGLAVSPNFAQDSTVLIGVYNGSDGTRYPPTVMYNGKSYPNQGLFLSTDRRESLDPDQPERTARDFDCDLPRLRHGSHGFCRRFHDRAL